MLSSIFYISALTTALVIDMFWGCPSFCPILENTVSHKHSLGLKGQLTRFWWPKVGERIHRHLTKKVLAITWDFIHYFMMIKCHTNAYYDKYYEWVTSKRSNARFTVTSSYSANTLFLAIIYIITRQQKGILWPYITFGLLSLLFFNQYSVFHIIW